MTWLKQLLARHRRYHQLSQSIREHLDETIEELMDNGMSREEAAHAARRQFGNRCTAGRTRPRGVAMANGGEYLGWRGQMSLLSTRLHSLPRWCALRCSPPCAGGWWQRRNRRCPYALRRSTRASELRSRRLPHCPLTIIGILWSVRTKWLIWYDSMGSAGCKNAVQRVD